MVLLDRVIVKGKTIPVAIYGIIPHENFATNWCADHNAFMGLVGHKSWVEAESALEQLKTLENYPVELLEQAVYRTENKISQERQMTTK